MAGKKPARKDRPPPLSPAEVTAIIRRCLRSGSVIPTKHFVDQGFQRNYTIQDAIHVLERGQVSGEAPEWNDKARRWGYRVHGPDLEGNILTVVVSQGPDPDRVWLVTDF